MDVDKGGGQGGYSSLPTHLGGGVAPPKKMKKGKGEKGERGGRGEKRGENGKKEEEKGKRREKEGKRRKGGERGKILID